MKALPQPMNSAFPPSPKMETLFTVCCVSFQISFDAFIHKHMHICTAFLNGWDQAVRVRRRACASPLSTDTH